MECDQPGKKMGAGFIYFLRDKRVSRDRRLQRRTLCFGGTRSFPAVSQTCPAGQKKDRHLASPSASDIGAQGSSLFEKRTSEVHAPDRAFVGPHVKERRAMPNLVRRTKIRLHSEG